MRIVAGAIGMAMGLAPIAARAQAPEWLAVETPPSCVTSAEGIAAAVEQLAATEGFAGRAEVRIVEVEEAPRGFRLEARVADAAGATLVQRTLQAPTCAEVLDAAAIIVALALAPPSADVPVRPDPTVVPAAPPAQPTPARRPEHAWSLDRPEMTETVEPRAFGVSLRLIALQGALPGLRPGGEIGAAYRWTSFRLEAGLLYGLQAEARDASSGGAADIDLIAGSLRGCWTAIAPLVLCGGFDVGVMRAEGHDLPSSRNGTGRWSAARLELRAEWRPEPVALGAGVAVVAPIDPPRFQIDGAGTVYQPAAVGLQVFLGLHGWIL